MNLFVVTKPGDVEGNALRAYTKLLNSWGIDVNDAPRVLQKNNEWRHAWPNREQAERFVRELRAVTGDDSWEVVDIRNGAMPHAKVTPVEIYVGWQSDGCALSLHPASRKLIKEKFPGVTPRPSLFIGYDTKADFERQHPDTSWDQLAIILTGLSISKLNELGGYRVYDPASEKIIWESTEPANASNV